MKAQEILDKYVKEEMHDKVGVIGILPSSLSTEARWYYIHNNEELPGEDTTIAIHVRKEAKKHAQ